MTGNGIRVGTAGWNLRRDEGDVAEGSRLERYSRLFSCVEINSSFYRPHRPATYARWAAAVPGDFRFSLKVPKEITHVRRMVNVSDLVDQFLDETAHLGKKRAALLVQLPPSFAYDPATVPPFFAALHERFDGLVVCEPRHTSWFTPPVDDILRNLRIARVAADPALVPAAGLPGGWDGFVYLRLHGAPRMYYSSYDRSSLEARAAQLRKCTSPAWCIFDNTALGAGTANALDLERLMREGSPAGLGV
jgi:uncharacterized protein YecE (DUF72 family)